MNEFSLEPIKALIEKIHLGEYYIIDYKLCNKKNIPLGHRGTNGYKVYNCRVGTKDKKVYAHRLIFAYYYGIDELVKYESINHIDGNKLNNNIANLEGMSLVDNTKHQWETGLAKRGSDCDYAVLDELQVSQIKKLLHLGYSQRSIATHYNVHRSTILNINLGNNWRHVELSLDVEIPIIPKEVKRIVPNKILSEDDVNYIKSSVISGVYTRAELAEMFGVSYSAIRKYCTGLRVNKYNQEKKLI